MAPVPSTEVTSIHQKRFLPCKFTSSSLTKSSEYQKETFMLHCPFHVKPFVEMQKWKWKILTLLINVWSEPRRSRWRLRKAEKWLAGSMLSDTWSARPRPRMACAKCLRWQLERRCRSASTKSEAAARCCEQSRRHKMKWPIRIKLHVKDRPFTRWHLCTVSCISQIS